MKEKFYVCRHCGNLVGMIRSSGVSIVCCGEKMEALVPNTNDGATEKHVPVVVLEGNKVHVNIGEVDHPMVDNHYIEWVYLETENGGRRRILKPNDSPSVTFCVKDDKPVAVYAYCNLHGLWVKEL